MNCKLKNFQVCSAAAVAVSSLLLLGILPSQANAQYVLTDNNSSVFIYANSDNGMGNWVVDGQTQLYKQWFFYRVGDTGAQFPINDLSAPTTSQPTANTLNVSYASGQFSISAAFNLQGGAAGSGESSIGEVLTIQNNSTTALPFHFFNYTDFDLGGTYAGDTVQLNQNLSGLFTTAMQSKGGVHFADAIISPGADHGEAALSPTLWNELTSTSPLTLNDFAGPVTGDATWALEWDPVIAPGGTFTVTITKSVTVPEPSVWALIPVSFVVLGMMKRLRRVS